jgi:hypothetical protein
MRVPVISNTAWADYLELAQFVDFGQGWDVNLKTPAPKNIASVGVGVLGAHLRPFPIRPQFEMYWGHRLIKASILRTLLGSYHPASGFSNGMPDTLCTVILHRSKSNNQNLTLPLEAGGGAYLCGAGKFSNRIYPNLNSAAPYKEHLAFGNKLY